MEALAMGSKKVDGSACEGIIVTNDLPVESNPYMTSSTNARNMFDRLDLLINKADIIVALPGSIGPPAPVRRRIWIFIMPYANILTRLHRIFISRN